MIAGAGLETVILVNVVCGGDSGALRGLCNLGCCSVSSSRALARFADARGVSLLTPK